MKRSKKPPVSGQAKRLPDPHRAVTAWFMEKIREREINPGDVLTVQEIATMGPFRFGTVRKGIAELASLGIVESIRSVGTRVLAQTTPDWRTRGRLLVGVLAPPSASMLAAVLEGVRYQLEEISRQNGLKQPVIVSLWAEQENGAPDQDALRLMTSEFDCLFALPCSTPVEILTASRMRATGILFVSIGSPSQPFATQDPNGAQQAGTLAAEHLLAQLKRFSSKNRKSVPPVFVFSEYPQPNASNSLQGCREALLSVSGLFWNPSEHVRHPGDIRTARWAPDSIQPEAWQAPQLRGEAAGRFFAAELLESGFFTKFIDTEGFRPPACGVICMSEGIAKGAIEAFGRNGIEVGRDVFVVAVDQEGRTFDSFLSRVQTNYRHLGELAVSEAMPRLIPTAPRRLAAAVEKAPPIFMLRRRRSTGDFLHKLWRTNPGPTVIKSLDKKVQYANPMLEDLRGLPTHLLRGKTPPEVWGEEEGQIIQDHDEVVRTTARPHVSCEWLPYHQEGGRRFTFRFPIMIKGSFDHIGTMGFDVVKVRSEPQRLVINPSNEHADSEDDPPDDLIEAYFECMPCSVLVRRSCQTVLYANSHFADLLALSEPEQLVGEAPHDLAQHYAAKKETDAHSLFFEEDSLPGDPGRRRVVRFPLLNSFFQKEADASIGFHASILPAVTRMLKAVDASRPFAGMIVPLTRECRQQGYLVRDNDLEQTVVRACKIEGRQAELS